MRLGALELMNRDEWRAQVRAADWPAAPGHDKHTSAVFAALDNGSGANNNAGRAAVVTKLGTFF